MEMKYFARSHEFLQKTEAWIRTNISKSIAVQELASAFHVTLRTLSRRLNEIAGISPIQFIRQIKSEHAIQLLQTTNLSFEEIT